MRLATLNEFRSLYFTSKSAPSVRTLKRKIDDIPGGCVIDGECFVDTDVFLAKLAPDELKARVEARRIQYVKDELVRIGLIDPPYPRREKPKRRLTPEEEAEIREHYGPRKRAPRPRVYHERRKLALRRATPPWANMVKIREIYRKAREFSKSSGRQYHVDHIVPLQGKLVSGLHVHYNLRIILAKDNCKKRNHWPEVGGG